MRRQSLLGVGPDRVPARSEGHDDGECPEARRRRNRADCPGYGAAIARARAGTACRHAASRQAASRCRRDLPRKERQHGDRRRDDPMRAVKEFKAAEATIAGELAAWRERRDRVVGDLETTRGRLVKVRERQTSAVMVLEPTEKDMAAIRRE